MSCISRDSAAAHRSAIVRSWRGFSPVRLAAIPPRRGAKIGQHGNSEAERLARDENLRYIRRVGRAKWKREMT